MTRYTLLANAKLNLYLDITGRRDDGYHLLETVMQSIDLSDTVTLEIDGGSGIDVSCSNAGIPAGEGNICHKAARLFLQAAGISAAVRVHIQKNIPSGAGMGGGSADAAAVLFGMNRHFGEPLSAKALNEAAVSVGADVPFCLAGGTKLCRGIGEIISEAPKLPEYRYLVVMPQFTCPTGAAFRRYDESPLPAGNGLDCFLGSADDLPKRMYNVFEELYADRRIEDLCGRMMSRGALGAQLTGSGAAVFGVFSDEQSARDAAEEFADLFTRVCAPAAEGVSIVKKEVSQ